MRILNLLAASTLALGLLTSLPLAAADPTAPAALAAQPAAAPKSPAPADLSGLFTPKPELRYGITYGPCTVSVTCLTGAKIACSGQSVCNWKNDVHGNPGFVRCDGAQITCP